MPVFACTSKVARMPFACSRTTGNTRATAATAGLLFLGDNPTGVQHTWEPTQNTTDDVDTQIHTDTSLHQNGKWWEDNGNKISDNL